MRAGRDERDGRAGRDEQEEITSAGMGATPGAPGRLPARGAWLAASCALSLACATAAQASPPDAGAAPAARERQRSDRWVARGRQPFLLLNPPEGAFMLTRRGHLGVQLLELTPELREHFGAPSDAGVLVAQVTADGPAAKAGVRVGDVLVAIDGWKVAGDSDVRSRIRTKKENDSATLEVVRNRSRQNLNAQIALKETTELDLVNAFGDKEHAFNFDSTRIHDAVDRAVRTLDRPEIRERLQRRIEADDKLQERTRALEQRIEKLERQLQQKK